MIKKIIFLITTFLFVVIYTFTINAVIENINLNNIINNFLQNPIYDQTLSSSYHKIYKIKTNRYLDEKTYSSYGNNIYPGGSGDIIISQEAAINIPIIYEIITYLIGGHASLSAFNYEDKDLVFDKNDEIQVTGFGDVTYVSKGSKNIWNGYNTYMAFRVDTSKQNRLRAFNRAISFLKEPYNYSFLFGTNNSKYCSDLISKSYEYVGIDLNKDGFFTTVNDLTYSNNIFMIYYSTMKNNVRYTFYLDN